ncbi:NAD(P)-dependent oxidoreductase, partial [Pseudonocardia kunmingensis]
MGERAGLPQAVGFVGLGRMGTPMVRRLAAAGVGVRGYDAAPRPELSPVVTQVEKAPLVAEGVPVVVLMLPDSDVVDAVVHGAGLLDALAPGTVLVDMGSSEPLRTRALAEQVAARGAVLVDAPVSGGVSGATEGTMTIMVGGPEDAVATLVPLFGVLGRMRHVGPVGAGHALKALNNLMSAAHLLASSEALLAGQRFGLDPAAMLEAVNGSSGRSGSTENKWPNFVLPGTFDSGFALGLMLKDIRIALGLAEATGAPSA